MDSFPSQKAVERENRCSSWWPQENPYGQDQSCGSPMMLGSPTLSSSYDHWRSHVGGFSGKPQVLGFGHGQRPLCRLN